VDREILIDEDRPMRIEQTFTVHRPPIEVFGYMTDPAKLAEWQTSKVSVQPLTDGPPRLGYMIKERTKMGLRQWDQVVEFCEFEPGRAFGTRIVEGSMPVDGRWTFEDDGAGGARVHFVAEGELVGLSRVAEPLIRSGVARSFRRYHALLARNLEGGGAG
jgi:carbon monoxide dehydrogenase subunit G